jgi:hypothetical protein
MIQPTPNATVMTLPPKIPATTATLPPATSNIVTRRRRVRSSAMREC